MRTRRDEDRPWRVSPGPWDSEPDWAEFEHEGLPCLMMRNRAGVWCGYVHVPPYNPVLVDAYGPEVHEDWPLDVHGGITWSGSREFSDGRRLFCVGFDLNHSSDGAPGDFRYHGKLKGTYRNFEYAVAEAERLAAQVAGYKPLEQMTNLFSGTSEDDNGKL